MIDANENKIKRAFERPQWYLTQAGYNIRIRAETVKEFAKDARIENILDIGCGDGSLSLDLLDENRSLTLLDRSKAMLNIASSRIPKALHSRVQILNEDFVTAQLPPQTFDLVVCVGVLAYVDPLRPFLTKIVSLLAPGGIAIVECSDGSHFVRRLSRAYGALRLKLGAGDFQTVVRPSSEVVKEFASLGFDRFGSFRYCQPFPVIRKLFSQAMSYNAIRLIYGTAAHSRAQQLGSECLYCFKRVQP